MPIQAHAPLRCAHEPHDCIAQGCFAHAIAADNTHDPMMLQGEGHPLKHMDMTVEDVEVLYD